MRASSSSPRETLAPEWLDRPGVPPAEVERAMKDLERVYRWLLGGRLLRRMVLAVLAAPGAVGAGPSARQPWCVDVGAGGGHVANDLQRAGRGRGIQPRVIGIDAKLAHLLAARRMGSVQLPVVADATAMPLASASVDCAFSHLFFHHFDGDTNRRILGEMRRLARRAVVVIDLRRSPLAQLLTRPALRLLGLGATAYHDGVVSMARSYRLAEVAEVVGGMAVEELRRRPMFRWSLRLAGERASAGQSG